jgi:hypothetical protein
MSGRIVPDRNVSHDPALRLPMANDPKMPRKRAGKLSRADLMALGKALDHKIVTGPLVSEPLPERFLGLLRRLDESSPPA